jgi:phage terminase Nu1 subunit (DNA packaging protein)
LEPSVRNYVRHLRERAAGRAGNNAKLSVVDESALLKRSQRLLNERKMAESEGRLIPYEQVAPAWGRVATSVRQHVLAIPAKSRFALPHLSAGDAQVLDNICRDVLPTVKLQGGSPRPGKTLVELFEKQVNRPITWL